MLKKKDHIIPHASVSCARRPGMIREQTRSISLSFVRNRRDGPLEAWASGAVAEVVAARVERFAAALGGGTDVAIVTFDEWGASGHANHVATSRGVARLLADADLRATMPSVRHTRGLALKTRGVVSFLSPASLPVFFLWGGGWFSYFFLLIWFLFDTPVGAQVPRTCRRAPRAPRRRARGRTTRTRRSGPRQRESARRLARHAGAHIAVRMVPQALRPLLELRLRQHHRAAATTGGPARE